MGRRPSGDEKSTGKHKIIRYWAEIHRQRALGRSGSAARHIAYMKIFEEEDKTDARQRKPSESLHDRNH